MRFDSLRIDWRTICREVIVGALCFLPRRRSIRLERWLRGWQEHGKLKAADCVIVSFPNSGRTWLHVLLLRYFQNARGYEGAHFTDLDALCDLDPAVPLIHFTHDNYLRDYTGDGAGKTAYRGRKVVLLVRDPADVAVSQFHQWRHRMRRRKKVINDYPLEAQLSLFDFTLGSGGGGSGSGEKGGNLARAMRFLNEWAAALPALPDVLLIRYEDLIADTATTLARLLQFLGEQPGADRLREAVDYASIGKMRALEQKGGRLFRPGRWRLRPAQTEGAFKARRAKVGGYRADFSAYEAALIDAAIDRNLAAVFGYRRAPSAELDPAASKARMRAATSDRSLDAGVTA